MGEKFFKNKVHLPEADSLEGNSISGKVPYYLIGDEAFPLQSWLCVTTLARSYLRSR